MDTLTAVVGAGRDRDGIAIDGPARPAPYRYPDFCSDVWKAGNLFSHYGVQNGGAVAVVPRGHPTTAGPPPASAMALVGMLGGTVVGSTVRVPTANPVDAGVVLAHVDSLPRAEIDGRSTVLAYGGDSDRADVERFEAALWSENPVEPPESVAPDDPCLAFDGEVATHGDLVRAATAVAEEYGVDASASVLLDAPLTDAGAVVAGLVTPLVVGATIRLGTDRERSEQDGAFLVTPKGTESGPGRRISTDDAMALLREV